MTGMPLHEPSRETAPFAGAGLEAATKLHGHSSGKAAVSAAEPRRLLLQSGLLPNPVAASSS
jgi:hypothetical protein